MRLPASILRGDHPPPDAAFGGNERDRWPSAADAIHAAVIAGEALIRTRLAVLVSRKPPTAIALRPAAATINACPTSDGEPNGSIAADVGALVYELLDAHADTADLAADLRWEPRWTAHLDYLRALQRTGREALAHMSSEDPA